MMQNDRHLPGMLRQYIASQEVEEILAELGLDEETRRSVLELLEKWEPAHDLDYLVQVVEPVEGKHNHEKIVAAVFAIAMRATSNYRLIEHVELP